MATPSFWAVNAMMLNKKIKLNPIKPAQGNQGADREVAAGATDDLCFAWDLPLGTGNAFQDVTGGATFTFDAEQTVHNP